MSLPAPRHLPLALAPRPTGDAGSELTLDGRRILLVEDEAMVGMEIEFCLSDAGAEVVGPVMRVQQGLALLQDDTDFAAAILDVDLHGEDVFPIALRLLELGVPFLFHTGHADKRDLKRMFPDAPVCIKPTQPDELLLVVGHLLA